MFSCVRILPNARFLKVSYMELRTFNYNQQLHNFYYSPNIRNGEKKMA